MPTTITHGAARVENDYTYAGVKLGSRLIDSAGAVSEQRYYGPWEVRDGSVYSVSHPEGRVRFAPPESPKLDPIWFEYFLKDHLGSTRVVLRDRYFDQRDNRHYSSYSDPINSPRRWILEWTDYYPFGMPMDQASPPVPLFDHRFTYTGQEFIEEAELDWMDYGARWYDPQLARFSSVDPLASSMPAWSPYSYTFNNPVNNTDPDGRIPVPVIAGAAGFLIGAGLEVYSQWDQESINWGQVGKSGLKGGATAALISVGAPAAVAALEVTGGGALLTTAGVGAVASGGVEAADQLATTGEIDGGEVAVAAAGGAVGAPLGGVAGRGLSRGVTASGMSRAGETLRAATSGRTLTQAQKAASKALGAGATNAERAAARSAVRSEVNTTARAAHEQTVRNVQQVGAAAQGAGGATTSGAANQASQSLLDRAKSWWNGDN